jgi:hypothetical protein
MILSSGEYFPYELEFETLSKAEGGGSSGVGSNCLIDLNKKQ